MTPEQREALVERMSRDGCRSRLCCLDNKDTLSPCWRIEHNRSALSIAEKEIERADTRHPQYQQGRRNGIKWAVTWLAKRAEEMNEQKAKDILNTASFNMGAEAKRAFHSSRGG